MAVGAALVSSIIVGKTSRLSTTVLVGSAMMVGKTSRSSTFVLELIGSSMIVGKTSRSSTTVLLVEVEVPLAEVLEAVGVLLVLLNPSPHRLQVRVMAPDSRMIMPKRPVGWVDVGFVVLVLGVLVVVLEMMVEEDVEDRVDDSEDDNDEASEDATVVLEISVHVDCETRERIAVSRIACVVCWSFIVAALSDSSCGHGEVKRKMTALE